jgi:hypothetical protein
MKRRAIVSCALVAFGSLATQGCASRRPLSTSDRIQAYANRQAEILQKQSEKLFGTAKPQRDPNACSLLTLDRCLN